MADEKYEWHRIADAGEQLAAQHEIRAVKVGSKKLCFTYHDNKLFAFSSKCPHAGGQLADGHIDAHGNIVCPVHRYKFCLKNGYNTSGEGYFLKTYPVECRDDGIYIGFARTSVWDIFKK